MSIDRNGLMSPWHPLFDHLNIEKSKQLRLPNGMTLDEFKKTYYDEDGIKVGFEITEDDRLAAIEISNISDQRKKNKAIKKFLRGLNMPIDNIIKIQDIIERGDKLGDEDLVLVMSLINQWTPSTGGFQNAAINDKNNVLNNPKNYVMASTPMDGDTFSSLEVKDAKFKLIKENPLYPAQQKIINMDGKDGIGIFAVAMKGFSGISIGVGNSLSDANKAIENGVLSDEEITEKYIKPIIANVSFSGSRSILPTNTNINELKNKDKIAGMILNSIGQDGNDKKLRDAFLFTQRVKPDLGVVLSELVTAATDRSCRYNK